MSLCIIILPNLAITNINKHILTAACNAIIETGRANLLYMLLISLYSYGHFSSIL